MPASIAHKGVNCLESGDSAEYQGAQNRDRIRRGRVEMAGNLPGSEQSRDGCALAKHATTLVGGKAAERIGDSADERISEEWRDGDSPCPVRFGRPQRWCGRQAIAARGIEGMVVADAG